MKKISNSERQRRLAQRLKDISKNSTHQIVPLSATLESTQSGFLVENWHKGWYWFSNLAFAAIVAVNAAPIPPELIQALPAGMQTKATIALAILGVIGRMVNQSKKAKAEVFNDNPA